MYPLRFEPMFRRYLWGGRRLHSLLGKPLGDGDDYAESWEVVDHGADQSVVACGPLQGATLHQLVTAHGRALLGRHHPQSRFPLLFKFLDAHRDLSVQVHPPDALAARLQPPDLGKTEAWVVLHADPGSKIYAGLKQGVDRREFQQCIAAGQADRCLHSFEPGVGDCVFIPAGTVHALGAGLVVAEIQQASNTTFRLFDWNRLGPDGRPRALHIDAGLAATDFAAGPVWPRPPVVDLSSQPEHLVACEHFRMDRWTVERTVQLGGDDAFHLIAILGGRVVLEGDFDDRPLVVGQTALLPAAVGPVRLDVVNPATVLDIALPSGVVANSA
jgi:mannose-6-phosphate isomerase